MIDFSKIKEITIPEGKVSKIEINNTTVWTGYDRYIAELQYIESTGTQYIDTLIKGNKDNLIFDFEYQLITWKAYAPVFGNYKSENDNCWRMIYTNTNNNAIYCSANSKASVSATITVNKSTNSINFSKTKMIVNGSTKNINLTTSGTENENNICIFRAGPSASSGSSGFKLYYFKIYDNGVLVRDFIPVIAPVNGNPVACLYDKVSKRLFYNKGTGEFKYG